MNKYFSEVLQFLLFDSSLFFFRETQADLGFAWRAQTLAHNTQASQIGLSNHFNLMYIELFGILMICILFRGVTNGVSAHFSLVINVSVRDTLAAINRISK